MLETLVVLSLVGTGGALLLRWCSRWGSTVEERRRPMPGDGYLEDPAASQVAMTRAITIAAPPERVWPWLAQLGRGAGWYSIDWLDNGRRTSAWHLVSWIPDPRPGDATAIGYLRHIDQGSSLAWWVDGVRFLGARACLVSSYVVRAEGAGTRLVSRMSASTSGPTALVATWVFQLIDSIMATRQLIGIRQRVDYFERGGQRPRDPETGARDQYQLYEIIYADGSSGGAAGKEHAARWRQSAIEDGVLGATSEPANHSRRS